MHRSCVPWLIATLAALFPTSLVAAAPSDPAWRHKVDKGFIDDPVAFDATESRFAFIHTDSATFLTIVLMRTAGFQREKAIKVEDPTLVPQGLAFTPDGGKLLLLWMEGRAGTHGATLYDLASGKAVKRVGPATQAAIAEHKGEMCLTLTQTSTDAKGSTAYVVAVHRASDLKQLGTGRITVPADQMLRAPPLRLLYWDPGHLSLLGVMKGKYDRKRDVRLPERAVRYGIVQRRELWAQEPKEVLAWAKATSMRPKHPGQSRFVQVSDDLKFLHLVDEANELSRLTTPVTWSLYEHKSLVQAESWDGKTLTFSLTIDPVNPAAVQRKKADRERVDLYRVGPGPSATLLGQVHTDKRTFSWVAGTRHFSYLRKLKGFGRGGKELEIHRIAGR